MDTNGTLGSGGTLVSVVGVAIIAGVAYFIYKKNTSKKENAPKKRHTKIISDENKYKGDKRVIVKAIEEKDWDTLEEMLKDRSLKKYPDLIKMAEDALRQKP